MRQVAEWMGEVATGCPFDFAQGKRAERLTQGTGRIGLRGRAGGWRWWRDWIERVKRVFVGHGVKLEMGRGKRKKQVPRCARNDNLRVFRRVAEVWLWAAGRS